jgi:High-temperature-induced dauer-formation protein
MGQSASKEKFRESVNSLIEVDVSSDDADFWDELWKIPSSALEVFELLTANQVRRLRDDRFENLATLFTQAVAQLCQIVETPYNIYFDQALNCVRVLTRVLPFVLEKGALCVFLFYCGRCCFIWSFSNEPCFFSGR